MRKSLRERPPWLARIEVAGEPVGAGVLITPELVLTCHHVVPRDDASVTLVHHDSTTPATVVHRIPIADDESGDLAVLRLGQPTAATPAPLRAPSVLSDHSYRVQGFASGLQAEARGTLGAWVGSGWVQLNGGPGRTLDHGFSGGPVWDDELEAVVGIVVTAEPKVRGGHMIPVEEVIRHWPDAAAFTGWRLDLDDAFDTHWLPRARGVEPHVAGDVWHFVGRRRALQVLAEHLSGEPDGRARVVTGSPGSGKSAVLARTVVLADRVARRLVPPETLSADPPPVGSITVAVHARGKTVADVVRAIASATEVEAVDQAQLLQRLRGEITVVVDALDEAVADSVTPIAILLNRLAASRERRVIVGVRTGVRGSKAHLVLDKLGDPVVMDLDAPEYLDRADVLQYVRSRVDNVAAARAIADHAGGNFLIAQLAALSGSTDRLPTTVGAAIDDYLELKVGAEAQTVRDLLLPLAFLEGSGLPEGALWLALANALTLGEYTPRQLRMALGSAASYLVEQVDSNPPMYRLFHQALDDVLRAEHTGPNPDEVVYTTMLAHADDDYVRTNLFSHAARAGALDQSLLNLPFLLSAPPERVLPHLDRTEGDDARAIAHVYRRSSHHLGTLAPEERKPYFALVARQTGYPWIAERVITGRWHAEVVAWTLEEAQQVLARTADYDGVGVWFDVLGTPALLASAEHGVELHRLEEHRLTRTDRIPLDEDWRIRAFDHVTLPSGEEVALTVSSTGVLSKWSLSHGLRLLGSVSLDLADTWDVEALCTTDRRLLAVATNGRMVFVVDFTADHPTVLSAIGIDLRHALPVAGATIGQFGDEVLIAYLAHRLVRLSSLTGDTVTKVSTPMHLHGRTSGVLRFLPAGPGRVPLAVASDGHFTVVDVAGGRARELASAPGLSITAIKAVSDAPDPVLVLGGEDGSLRISPVPFDPGSSGEPRTGHEGRITSVAAKRGDGRHPVILSAGVDDRVRLWSSEAATPRRFAPPPAPDETGATHLAFYNGGLTTLTCTWYGDIFTRRVEAALSAPERAPHPIGQSREVLSTTVWHDSRGNSFFGCIHTTVDGLDHTMDVLRRSSTTGAWEIYASGPLFDDDDDDDDDDDYGSDTYRPWLDYRFTQMTFTWDDVFGPTLAIPRGNTLTIWEFESGGFYEADNAAYDTTSDGGIPPSAGLSFFSEDDELRLFLATASNLTILSVDSMLDSTALGIVPNVRHYGFAEHPHGTVLVVHREASAGAYEVQPLLVRQGKCVAVCAPWPHKPMDREKIVVRADSPQRFTVAIGRPDGKLDVWAHDNGTTRTLGDIDTGSGIQDLAWRSDLRLVVWCRSGLLEFDFDDRQVHTTQ